jgi:heme exporter protein D
MSDFLSMGGFGMYVWAAYGVTAVLVIVEVIGMLAHRRTVHRQARASKDSQ